jgi:CysZ protein
MLRAPKTVHSQDLGFLAGARCLGSAVGFLRRSPQLWAYAAVPALVLTVVSAIGLALAARYSPGVGEALAPEASSWWGALFARAIVWIVTFTSAVLAVLAAMLLTPVLSAPALDHLVVATERHLGAPMRAELGLLRELWCGIRAAALAAAMAFAALAVLSLVEIVAPVLAVVTIPLKLTSTALSLSWSLLDYPLTLRGVALRARLALMRRHFRPALGFGAAFAIAFWVPCCSILLLPVGVVGATLLMWDLAGADPELQEMIGVRAAQTRNKTELL